MNNESRGRGAACRSPIKTLGLGISFKWLGLGRGGQEHAGEPCRCCLQKATAARLCRARSPPRGAQGCPGSTSLFPARLNQDPLLQRARPVLAQHLAAAGSAGSPGRALPD